VDNRSVSCLLPSKSSVFCAKHWHHGFVIRRANGSASLDKYDRFRTQRAPTQALEVDKITQNTPVNSAYKAIDPNRPPIAIENNGMALLKTWNDALLDSVDMSGNVQDLKRSRRHMRHT
jgi:hypothetical protein